MTFNVVLQDETMYTVSFIVDEEATFCNIINPALGCTVSAGHTLLSPSDEFDSVEGMKWALKRALEAPPCLFDRETRGLIWDTFWAFVDPTTANRTYTLMEWTFGW